MRSGAKWTNLTDYESLSDLVCVRAGNEGGKIFALGKVCVCVCMCVSGIFSRTVRTKTEVQLVMQRS